MLFLQRERAMHIPKLVDPQCETLVDAGTTLDQRALAVPRFEKACTFEDGTLRVERNMPPYLTTWGVQKEVTAVKLRKGLSWLLFKVFSSVMILIFRNG